MPTATSTPAGVLQATSPGKRILVFGASGYIGSHLVPALVAEGHTVRAVARSTDALLARGWNSVECMAADALQPDSLPAIFEEIDVAYYLVHSMAAGKAFGSLDVQAAQNFAQAASSPSASNRAASGMPLRRIIYLGGLVPPTADTEHIVSRQQTGEALREGSVPVTEIRAGIIVGPGSAAFEVMRDLVFHLPVMITPRWVQAQSPPIALENLLYYLLRLPEIPESAGEILDAAGPEVLSYAQMMHTLAEVAGIRSPRIFPVPLLTPRLSSYWLHLITTVPTPVARALIEGMRQDFVADDSRIREWIPQPLLDFRSAVAAAFAAEREHTVLSRWTEGALACRNYRPDYAFYAKRASAQARTSCSPAQVWRVVQRIGGSPRYFYADALWRTREFLDFLIGGPGMTYGRRHPEELRVGDTIDSWRVIAMEPERRLTLQFGMRAPGAGVLELTLHPLETGCTVQVTAYWHPAGLWGLLYWYALVPAHQFLFTGMTRRIAELAEQESSPPHPE